MGKRFFYIEILFQCDGKNVISSCYGYIFVKDDVKVVNMWFWWFDNLKYNNNK